MILGLTTLAEVGDVLTPVAAMVAAFFAYLSRRAGSQAKLSADATSAKLEDTQTVVEQASSQVHDQVQATVAANTQAVTAKVDDAKDAITAQVAANTERIDALEATVRNGAGTQ